MNKHTKMKLIKFAKSAGCAVKLGQTDQSDMSALFLA